MIQPDHGGHKQRARSDRSDLVAPQDVELAFLKRADSGAEQPASQNTQRQRHGDHLSDAIDALPGAKHCTESEKEDQREQVVEEDHGP